MKKRNIIKILILVVILCCLGIVGFKWYSYSNSSNYEKDEEVELELLDDDNKGEEIVEKISVDVKGAVNNPGVYEIDSDKKVIDAVNLSGGLRDEADTSLINLAKKVSDEMVIIIYTKDQVKEARRNDNLSVTIKDSCVCPRISNDACLNNNSSNESKSSGSGSSSENNDLKEKININTATLEELQTLTGIGAGKAQSIIDYRIENGDFSKIEDIMNVSGIGEAVFEKIKEYITV